MLLVLLSVALLALSSARSPNYEDSSEEFLTFVSDEDNSSQSPEQETQRPRPGGRQPAPPSEDVKLEAAPQQAKPRAEGNQNGPPPPPPGRPQRSPPPQGGSPPRPQPQQVKLEAAPQQEQPGAEGNQNGPPPSPPGRPQRSPPPPGGSPPSPPEGQPPQ